MFNYNEAFACNVGLIKKEELARLRQCRVGIAGMGAVGGEYLLSLARTGLGAFTIADFDKFELKNFNRQCGSMTSTLDQSKAHVMAAMARDINPELRMKVMEDAISEETVDDFLEDLDVVVDGMDIFEPDAHRLLITRALERKLAVLAALPSGFGAGMVVFTPGGMSFDNYFDFRDSLSEQEKVLHLLLGFAPAGYHMKYLDLSSVDLENRKGPSSIAGVKLCASLVTAHTLLAILSPKKLRSAPWYVHMDARLCRTKCCKLFMGNRNPVQRLKKHVAMRLLFKP